MKRNIFFYIIVAASFLAGCSKSYLSDVKPTDGVTEDQVFSSAENVRVYLNGIYRNFRNQASYGATDSWAINSVMIARENKGTDFINDQNWYIYDYMEDNRNATYRRVSFTWRFFYEFMNQANNVIAKVSSSNTIGDDDKEPLVAEGKALRAYCLFELTREFSKAFLQDSTAAGVPIYLTPTYDSLPGNPRGTIKEDYDQIIKDLTEAIPALPQSRDLSDQINYDVASGILARVYLEKGDYKNALAQANNVLADYPVSSSEYTGPLNTSSNPEGIWVLQQSSDQTLYYGTMSSFYGNSPDGNGYYCLYLSPDLNKTFSATDVRRNLIDTVSGGDLDDYYYAFTSKFGLSTDFTEALVLMRASELELIKIESLARLGNESEAKTELYNFQKLRDSKAVESSNTGTALINEILLERRKELYGEVGTSYMDAKRLQLPVTRTTTGHPQGFRISLIKNDYRFLLAIPQTEIDANANISADEQNPASN